VHSRGTSEKVYRPGTAGTRAESDALRDGLRCEEDSLGGAFP
jgi:hypothetical protein